MIDDDDHCVGEIASDELKRVVADLVSAVKADENDLDEWDRQERAMHDLMGYTGQTTKERLEAKRKERDMADSDDNDCVALQSVPHPIEITEVMLDAGEKVHQGLWWQQRGLSERDVPAPLPRAVLAEIYTAMVHAAPPEPGDLNESSLEHALIEIGLHEDTVSTWTWADLGVTSLPLVVGTT